MPLPPPRRWTLAPWLPDEQRALAEALGISPLLAQLLLNRGISGVDDAAAFLDPRVESIPDPFQLEDMDRAVERVIRAIRKQEMIVVFGDYDVDGTSASAVLLHFLRHYGARVEVFIPHREKDGYGLLVGSLRPLVEKGARLVITCDNGTSSHEAIHWAAEQGVDVIVTDHHSLPDPLPNAAAILNPRRSGTPAALRPLSGAGIAFVFALALRSVLRGTLSWITPPNLKRALDLVSLGTVADVVPLVGINRVLVHHGLSELGARRRPGLRALLTVAGVKDGAPMTSDVIAFRLAPRLNAAGRMEDARTAVELLATDDEGTAQRLAAHLDHLNRERQRVEEGVLAQARASLAARQHPERGGYVVAGEGWHSGVVGIVAARLMEEAHRPMFVLAVHGQSARGSGRSIPGVDLFAALSSCAELFTRFGGHPAAAGVSLQAEQIDAFEAHFDAFCRRHLSAEDRVPGLSVDAWLDPTEIDMALVRELHSLQPFGCANPEPIFASRDLHLVDSRRVGGGQHLRLRFQVGRRHLAGIGFRLGELDAQLSRGQELVVAHSLQINEWNGTTSVQLMIRDVQATDQPLRTAE